jgi:[pyruvate, water dikinase]-phosphate phosphotransferase / [pyruvate, water dikinase] kinase
MPRLNLHLLSDSTGETLEAIAKAALAQFEGADVVRHFWPMVRSQQHLDRIMGDIADNPGLVFYTMASTELRGKLVERCRTLGLPVVSVLDSAVEALESALGQHPRARPGRQHIMDKAYFARVDAIQFTMTG